MRIPVPRNRLVTLTLIGFVLTGLLSVTLAAPGLIPGSDGSDEAYRNDDLLPSDAPQPNADFVPTVQDRGADEYDDHDDDDHDDDADEYEEYDDHADDDEYDDDD